MERRLIRQNGNGLHLSHGRKRTRPIALRRTSCVLQGLERDGQRTRAGILADVNDSRRDNVEPFHHRRIRLLDCFARYGESSFNPEKIRSSERESSKAWNLLDTRNWLLLLARGLYPGVPRVVRARFLKCVLREIWIRLVLITLICVFVINWLDFLSMLML